MRLILFLMLLTSMVITAKYGASIDPNGSGRRTIVTTEGPILDPNGTSHESGVVPDAGPRMDPDG